MQSHGLVVISVAQVRHFNTNIYYTPKGELFVAVLGAGQPEVLVPFLYVLVSYNLTRPYMGLD